MYTYHEIIKAKRQADFEIYQEGIEYDFDQMEYVDPDGEVVSSESVAATFRDKMNEALPGLDY